MVWSAGKGPLYDLGGLNLADDTNTDNGFTRVRELSSQCGVVTISTSNHFRACV